MKGYLLDTNLLIALLWPAHERHEPAEYAEPVRV